jgi:hypothetical protein
MQVLESAAVPGFSFRYDDVPSAELLSGWQVAEQTEEVGVARRTYRDPATGLEVALTLRRFADFPALEWVIEFANRGEADTPILEEI